MGITLSGKYRSDITIEQLIKTILFNLDDDFIFVNTLIKKVSEITGYSIKSVWGSSLSSKEKIIAKPWFYENFAYLQKDTLPTRITKKSALIKFGINLDNLTISTITYNTPEKEEARHFVFDEILKINAPRILTMAGEEGLDVKMILSQNKNSIIDNVERDENILKRYQQLSYKTTDYNLSINNFIKKYPTNKYDLIYYDIMGYLCDYVADDMFRINHNQMAKEISITISKTKTIRNYGKFVDFIKEKYKNNPDFTLAYLNDIMTNYDFVSEFTYRQKFRTSKMRILKFRSKL